MPLPLVLAGLSLAAGAVGAKKAYNANKKKRKAKKHYRKAEEMVEEAHEALDVAKDRTSKLLSQLGETKITLLSGTMSRFLKTFSRVRKVALENAGELPGGNFPSLGHDEIKLLEKSSASAAEIAGAGVASAGTGALVAMGAYGATTTLATAGTGTAISALSGVAASNATLAWLGGGSLAAGGMGVAGGTAMLGGLVSGPAIMVMGFFMERSAQKALDEAKMAREEAETIVEEMAGAREALRGIGKRTEEINNVIKQMDPHFVTLIGRLEAAIDRLPSRRNFLEKMFFINRYNPKRLTEEEQKVAHLTYSCAKVMHALLNAPVVDEKGAITQKSKEMLLAGRQFTSQIGQMVGTASVV